MKTLSIKRLAALSVLSIAAYLPASAFANATLYQHCDYGGARVTLGPGDYDLPALNARGIRNDDISSLSLNPGYRITIYEHHRFGGRSLTFSGNDSCLVNDRFNDTLSSLKIRKIQPPPRPGVATVYQHCNYGGYGINLQPGNYDLADLNRLGIRNDDLSALKVKAGYEIVAYQHHHFGGKSLIFRGNDNCLVDNQFNDTISSIRVRRATPPPVATVYQHCNFAGYARNLAPGRYNLGALTRLGIRNDDLSALRVPNGLEMIVYEHDNFGGRALTFRGNDACLVDNRFNDIISSVVIRRR